MKNNSIGKIAIASEGRKKTLKNKSSDLHTTMDFGTVMCGKLQRVIPGTTIKVGTKERVLLTSLVAPCFGRMSLKAYHTFIPFSDLTRNYAPMMARQFVARSSGNASFIPSSIPSVPTDCLSAFVLFGSQMTIYRCFDADHFDLLQIPSNVPFNAPLSALPQGCQDCISDLGLAFGNSTVIGSTVMFLKPNLFVSTSSPHANLALSNPNFASLFDYQTQHPINPQNGESWQFGQVYVSLEGADYVIPVSVEVSQGVYHHYILAFRLSSFGRRLRKNLIGCGWQFNLDTDQPLSILPLIAYYKAYFDVFGLTLYNNWEQTRAYKIMQGCDLVLSVIIDPFGSGNQLLDTLFREFILYEFGNTFYTDEQDFVSSHTRNTAVSPQPSGLLGSVVADVTSSGTPNISVSQIGSGEPSDLTTRNGHAFVNDVFHGQLDSELLKRLYRSTNAQTIAGRRIAELLKAQGLGAYVDECKSNFIGSWSLDLNVYDLPSQSDTYQNVYDGKRLGEFGAFGKSSGEHPLVSYDSVEDGYFITLLVVVPKGGYAETFDPDMFCLTKYDQYNPIWDSLGYQYDRKMTTVQGSQPWKNQALNVGNLAQSFGLAPRDFFRKFGRNVINGDFSLRSTRTSYLPFCLEKVLDVGEHKIGDKVVDLQNNLTRIEVDPFGLNADNLPIAGDVWRYPTRYEWISRFNRIFYNDSSSVDQYSTFGVAFGSTGEYEYFSLRDDNFVCHIIFEIQVWDQMLPVQDSYETSDDENHADKMMSKA